jgi:tetratricopeptide (TPR) repeat protein
LSRYNNILRWHVIKTKSASVQSSNADISNAYKDIAKKLSNDPVVLIDYGKYLMKNSQYTEAIGVLKEASLYSSNHTIFMYLGESYEKLGDHSLAIRYYKYASVLIPNLFYPKYRLMNIYKNNGMNQDCLRTAMEITQQPIKVESRVVREIKSAAIEVQNMLQRKPLK